MLRPGISIRYFPLGLLFFLLSSFLSSPAGLNDDILRYTNKFRRSKGLSALIMRDDLNRIARRHSEDMARGRTGFGHGGYDQRTKEIRELYHSYTTAENVAYGPETGKDVVAEWKNSSGHRRNMLGDYRYMGTGTARSKRGILYFTQIFVR